MRKVHSKQAAETRHASRSFETDWSFETDCIISILSGGRGENALIAPGLDDDSAADGRRAREIEGVADDVQRAALGLLVYPGDVLSDKSDANQGHSKKQALEKNERRPSPNGGLEEDGGDDGIREVNHGEYNCASSERHGEAQGSRGKRSDGGPGKAEHLVERIFRFSGRARLAFKRDECLGQA